MTLTAYEQSEEDFLRFLLLEQYRLEAMLKAIRQTIVVYEAQRAPETAQPVETAQTPVPTPGAQTAGEARTSLAVALRRDVSPAPTPGPQPKPRSGPAVIPPVSAPVRAVASTIAAANGAPIRATVETVMNWAAQRDITGKLDMDVVNARRRKLLLPPFEILP